MRGATIFQRWFHNQNLHFNPRAPCGARRSSSGILLIRKLFQPTRPLRGATRGGATVACRALFQPTRPLRGATDSFDSLRDSLLFQPTRPLRGATLLTTSSAVISKISTHAPLAGRDSSSPWCFWLLVHFNPRAPCGARLLPFIHILLQFVFQPTRPLRGATHPKMAYQLPYQFQPTRPLRGATYYGLVRRYVFYHFNPRAPCGARQQKSTNHYAHFCDNRQISDAFAQNAACQGILLLFDAGKPCGFWVRTAQVISAHLCFAL